MRRGALLLLLAATPGCDRRASASPPDGGGHPAASLAPSSAPGGGIACVRDDSFPAELDVPEASAAAIVELTAGARDLLVVSDSGRHGAAVLWRGAHGPARPLTLPLDGAASDDVEGISWVSATATGGGGALYTLTSSGAVRRFVPDGHGGLRRDQDAYPIGPAPYACPNLHDTNCGRNYEGLCLRPRSQSARCAGYAASRANATLECLVFDGDRLQIDALREPVRLPRGLVPAGSLSDCAFGAADGPGAGTLLLTTNVYGGSATYVVADLRPTLVPLEVPGTLNNEAVGIDHLGGLFLFGDIDAEVSPGLRATCKGW